MCIAILLLGNGWIRMLPLPRILSDRMTCWTCFSYAVRVVPNENTHFVVSKTVFLIRKVCQITLAACFRELYRNVYCRRFFTCSVTGNVRKQSCLLGLSLDSAGCWNKHFKAVIRGGFRHRMYRLSKASFPHAGKKPKISI